jgi:hypothetical protein
METQAYFDNLSDNLIAKLLGAKKSIHIAVAWFTHREIWEALKKQSQSGVEIYLLILDDLINTASEIDYSEYKSQFSFYAAVGDDMRMLHHKFCVIDYRTVITGSYNWSYKGNINYENLIAVIGDIGLCTKYVAEWEKIAITVGFESKFDFEAIEIATLDYQITTLETEKTNIRKSLNEYLFLYQKDIEPLVTKLLLLKTQLAASKFKLGVIDISEKENAEEEFKKYQEYQNSKAKETKVFPLNEEELSNLKKSFRTLVHKCHPDKIEDGYSEIAEMLFKDLRRAFETNDLDAFERVKSKIEETSLPLRGNEIKDINRRKITLFKLKSKYHEILDEIKNMLQSKTYDQIKSVTDVVQYVHERKKIVESEILLIESEIAMLEEQVI